MKRQYLVLEYSTGKTFIVTEVKAAMFSFGKIQEENIYDLKNTDVQFLNNS